MSYRRHKIRKNSFQNIFPIYVANISSRVHIGDLRKLFSPFGTVLEVTIVSDHGFVNFSNHLHAQDAIHALNGHSICQRRLHVDYSDEFVRFLQEHRIPFSLTRNPEESRRSKRSCNEESSSRCRQISKDKSSRRKRVPSSLATKVTNDEPKRKTIEEFSKARKKKKNDENENENENESHDGVDLREFLKKRNPKIKIEVKVSESRNITLGNSLAQVFYLGNLQNAVQRNDVERLFENVGPVLDVEMREKEAIVTVECSFESAKEAIETLDKNTWMDNRIVVKFSDRTKTETNSPRKPSRKPLERKSKEEEVEAAEIANERKVKGKSKKIRYFILYSPTMDNKNFIQDMMDVFSRYGSVQDCRRNTDGRTLLIQSVMSERMAINCIIDTNKIRYKGSELRVKFAEGSDEDQPEFLNKYSIDIRRYYPHKLIPEYDKNLLPSTSNTNSTTMMINSTSNFLDRPIGVLPPNSTLEVFAFSPSYRPTSHPNISSSKSLFWNVEGCIHTINNKIIIMKFSHGGQQGLAKFIPGTMYVNGHYCLGFLIKNATFHNWPQNIRDFLQLGAPIRMDIKKMTDKEIADVKELTAENVYYSSNFVWKTVKPEKMELSASNGLFQIVKGTLIMLFPKWGVLKNEFHGHIFFTVSQLYRERNESFSSNRSSLLTHLELGDVLAAQISNDVDYDVIRKSPGFDSQFHERVCENIQWTARLVWQIGAEVDPYSVVVQEPSDAVVKFLASSSTLNVQLPNEKDAYQRSKLGKIEEIHLPAGGLIRLNDDRERLVYFHRSRIYVNGVKMQSSASLANELIPGDDVRVDIVSNQIPDGSRIVSCESAYWVATSVIVKTTDRGITFAKSLKMANHDSFLEPHVGKGRIVYLFQPKDNFGPVVSAVAVIETGEYSGQRVEFDRSVCEAFGHSLKSSDLSVLLSFGDEVFIQLKPYNSYCVEKLWIGFKKKSDEVFDNQVMKKYLYDHGLDNEIFDSIIKGQQIIRPFIPLKGQILRGRVKQIKQRSTFELLVIDASQTGELLYVEASRDQIYVYGRSLSKADLTALLDDDEVSFEIHPMYNNNEMEEKSQVMNVPKASLVWLGDETCRPHYVGSCVKPEISPRMDSHLNTWLRAKKLSEQDFEALISGQSSSKNNHGKESSFPDLPIDSETLKQAALLQQMKSSFGPTACLQALMLLLSESETSNETFTLATQLIKIKSEKQKLEEKKNSESFPDSSSKIP